jgi:hypothetical protein
VLVSKRRQARKGDVCVINGGVREGLMSHLHDRHNSFEGDFRKPTTKVFWDADRRSGSGDRKEK